MLKKDLSYLISTTIFSMMPTSSICSQPTSPALFPPYTTGPNANGITTLTNTPLNPGQSQLSGNPKIDGHPRIPTVTAPAIEDDDGTTSTPRQIASYPRSLPPYFGDYNPTSITTAMHNGRGDNYYHTTVVCHRLSMLKEPDTLGRTGPRSTIAQSLGSKDTT